MWSVSQKLKCRKGDEMNEWDSSSGTSQHLSPAVMSTVIQTPIPSFICFQLFDHCSVSLCGKRWYFWVTSNTFLILYWFLQIPCDACFLTLIHPLLPGAMGFSVCSSSSHFPAGQFLLSHMAYCPIWWATVPPESYRIGQDYTCTNTRVCGNYRRRPWPDVSFLRWPYLCPQCW